MIRSDLFELTTIRMSEEWPVVIYMTKKDVWPMVPLIWLLEIGYLFNKPAQTSTSHLAKHKGQNWLQIEVISNCFPQLRDCGIDNNFNLLNHLKYILISILLQKAGNCLRNFKCCRMRWIVKPQISIDVLYTFVGLRLLFILHEITWIPHLIFNFKLFNFKSADIPPFNLIFFNSRNFRVTQPAVISIWNNLNSVSTSK